MKIGILTSSRADYSIYLPLLKAISEDSALKMEMIAFGTHLSRSHGYTIKHIIDDGMNVPYQIDTLPEGDSPEEISKAMGKTMLNFAELWSKNNFDLVIALGDRYEMFAAVASSVPFNIRIAHIHGGETTEGAIDDAFRHSITHMSALHFTSAEEYKERASQILGSSKNVFNTGALSFDNLKKLKLLSLSEFKERFNIDLSTPTILITFHPETVSYEKNEKYISEFISALEQLASYQLVITMPNTDTMGNMIRVKLNNFVAKNKNAIGIESFGTIGYLSCMQHCSFMLGNTSSGFIEAAFFPKFVINIGDRQKGRIITPNIINCPVEQNAILSAVKNIEHAPKPEPIDTYGDGNAAQKIIDIIKTSR